MSFLHFLFNFILFSFSFNLLSMQEEEKKKLATQSSILFTKKEIASDNGKITTFKKNYTLQNLLSTIPLVSLIGITAYTSYKKNEIPLIDIIGFGIHKASRYNKQIETLFKKIPFNNTIYWQNPFKLFLTAPNILFLSTIGTTYALPQLTKKKFRLDELNSTEANEIIKSTDPLLDYLEFFKNIPVETTDITEFCLSIKDTNQNINLSEEQKTDFAKQINEFYKFSELQYNLDFFNNTQKLEALENAITKIDIEAHHKFFDENKEQKEAIQKIKETISALKDKLTDENIIKKISFLEKLKIKQQTLQHMLINKEEEAKIDINDEEETKAFLEIDYKDPETDLKKTNSLVKKITDELTDIYASQKELYEEIKNLKNPHQELFEESWNGIHDWQKEKILKEIILNKTSEKLSPYAVKKIDPPNTIQSLFLENQAEHFIKENYKTDFKAKILYFIKSSLPGHKITNEIEKKIEGFQKQKIKTGIEYDIEIISKLPTAELKDIYREEHFQHYTIANYRTLFKTAESIETIDTLTLMSLIKNQNFQMLLIDYLDTLNSEFIIKLTMHSPFLLNLSDKYTKFYDAKNTKNEKNKKPYTEEQYKKFESFLKNITTLKITSNNVYDTLPVYLKQSLKKYLNQNSHQNTQYWENNLKNENKNNENQKLLEYFNQQEELKKHFVIPSNQKK